MNNLKKTEKEILNRFVKKSIIDHIDFEIKYKNDTILLHSIKCYTDANIDNKENLLMIHGVHGNTISFAHIIDHLTDKFNLYIIDLPGFGQSCAKKELLINLSNLEVLDFYVYVIKQYIDIIIKSENNLACLACSFGALIAIEFTHRYPTYFGNLLLMSPAGILPFGSCFTFYIGTLFKYSFPHCILRLLGKHCIHSLAFFFGIFSKHLYYDLALVAEKHVFGDLLVAKFLSIDGLTAYHNYPVLFKLLTLDCKIGLIYQENDCIIPVDQGIKVHEMSNMPIHIINNAPHYISYIDGQVVADSIVKVYNESNNYVNDKKYENKDMNTLLKYKCNFNIFKSKKIIADFYNNFD
jgi:pimeloyl-ACP methyl ester carboxylesterase